MYIPSSFAETDPASLQDFIERHSFGLLVSTGAEPSATHLPFLLNRSAGPHGTLTGHMARANPQWREAGGGKVLAVFSGPHAYISPTWYKAEHVVPTWNYVAVHATGTLQVVEEPAELERIVRASVELYEASMPRPWVLPERAAYVERMLSQIVGFRIEIERLEGKWKLSQNHSAQRQEQVVQGLQSQPYPEAQAVAELMRDRLSPRQPALQATRLPAARDQH